MDFSPTKERWALQRIRRQFAREEITPRTIESDRLPDAREALPWDVIDRGAELGLKGFDVVKEFGGNGAEWA